MKVRRGKFALWVVLGLACPYPWLAKSANTSLTAREIMQRVDAREDGDDRISDLELLLIDKSGNERRREVRTLAKDYGDDTHQIVFFLSPADVKDTGLLTYDYRGDEREDDQWLYLPALQKTKRIASTDQSGSFLGTDFSYADLTRMEIDSYDFRLLDEDEVYGHPVWRIEAIPRTQEESDRTGYEKSWLFVRQDNFFIVRSVNWVTQGRKLKYFDVKTLEQIEGVWVGTEIHMTTKKGSTTLHKTILRATNVRFGQPLDDSMFSVRQLEKGP